MKTPHLLPACLAVTLTGVALTVATHYARQAEERSVHAIALAFFLLKTEGTAMQAAALRQPDLIVLYGGSEVITPNMCDAISVFRNYQEGFGVFPVGMADNSALPILQKLAALGPELKGKKIAVSLSPISVCEREMLVPENYAGNLSLLHAYELIFGANLSWKVKCGAARRMLDYPETLRREPVLRWALQGLACRSAVRRLGYYAALPLAKLRIAALRLQDHWETYAFLRDQGELPPVTREASPIDWPALLAHGAYEYRNSANSNPYGFANEQWLAHKQDLTKRPDLLTKEVFAGYLDHSREWTDIDLLLREMNELGAQPLLLSTPIMGRYYESLGIDAKLRAGYYDKLRKMARRYGIPLRCFQENDLDTDFIYDNYGHMNAKGWICYDQALAQFFHGDLR